jgi:hypothetical protein
MSNQERPTSQHVKSTASYGIGVSKEAVDQLSSSGNAAKQKRKALEEAREAKKAAEEKKAQEDLNKKN